MFWAFAAIVLILILTVTISNRGAVRIVGCILLAAFLGYGLVQRLGQKSTLDPTLRGKPASPAAVVAAFALDSVAVADIKLSGGGAPFEIRGLVTNNSQTKSLRSITLRIVRRDCFEGAVDPSGCAVIWQDQHWIQLTVPPQTERKFASSFWSRNSAPRSRGSIKDEFLLIAATGDADSTEQLSEEIAIE